MEYKPTIGLEVHAELKTLTKMFCSCKNDPDEKIPNVNICPVCTAQPGTLPVPNKEAIKKVLKVGIALGGKIGHLSEFDRKNYFYPDIPKGYQISQYKHPLVLGGELAGVKITRVHLEEDTARSQHGGGGSSLIDFNRAGVPLMELVTEPVMHSAEEAVQFGKELQLLLQYLGVAEANMQKGEIRFEANISLSEDKKLGTKVEVKNLNSFRALERAVAYEIARQTEVLQNGKAVKQETRGWDEAKEETFSQRSKEDSHDYRYFPDPDITKINIKEVAEFEESTIAAEMPETPEEKRVRFKRDYGLEDLHVEFYVKNQYFSGLFEKTIGSFPDKNKDSFKLLSNYITNDLAGLSNYSSVKAGDLAILIEMVSAGEVSSRGAKDIIIALSEGEYGPKDIAKKRGLIQKSDTVSLEAIAKKVIKDNKSAVAEYKSGKKTAIQFLIGQGMKASKGAANPAVMKEIFEKILS